MNDESRLKQLHLAIHGVNAPFLCAGKYVPEEPVSLKFKDGKRFVVEQAPDSGKQVATLKPLIDRCRPATFGDKRQNRLDRKIRDAVQLMAETGDLRVENFDPESAGILNVIRRELLPPGSPPITAELYALNIYTSGGHFEPHKDTPRGKDMFGTLVVCLPSRFWRGQLKCMHRGVVQRFDWGTDIDMQKQATQIHWAAFFGDVDHQIERVGTGARVTLTYLLRRDGQSLPSRTREDEDLAPAIQEAWRNLLADPSFLPKGGIVGYPCCHLYHQDARFQVKQEPLDQRSANMLKGRDQLVAATALQAGLGVTFSPYLFEDCVDETWQLARFPTRQEQGKLKRRMDLPALESALPIVGESSRKVGDFGVTWLEQPPSSNNGAKDVGSEKSADLPAAGRLHSCEYCEWGYFGNEASDVDFYIYAALHVRIPSLGEGARAEMRQKVSRNRKASGASSNTRPVKKKADASEKSSESAGKKSADPSAKRASKTTKRKRGT